MYPYKGVNEMVVVHWVDKNSAEFQPYEPQKKDNTTFCQLITD